jgi:hypothetical protein
MSDLVDMDIAMGEEGVAQAFGLMKSGKSKLRIESTADGSFLFSSVAVDYTAKVLSSLPPTVIAFGLSHADVAVRQETARQLKVGLTFSL